MDGSSCGKHGQREHGRIRPVAIAHAQSASKHALGPAAELMERFRQALWHGVTGSSDPLLTRRGRGRVDTHIVSTLFLGSFRPQPGFSPPNTDKHYCTKKGEPDDRRDGCNGGPRSLGSFPHADEIPTARSRYLGHLVMSRQIDKKAPFQDELK